MSIVIVGRSIIVKLAKIRGIGVNFSVYWHPFKEDDVWVTQYATHTKKKNRGWMLREMDGITGISSALSSEDNEEKKGQLRLLKTFAPT